jgi:hypothetical protein
MNNTLHCVYLARVLPLRELPVRGGVMVTLGAE